MKRKRTTPLSRRHVQQWENTPSGGMREAKRNRSRMRQRHAVQLHLALLPRRRVLEVALAVAARLEVVKVAGQGRAERCERGVVVRQRLRGLADGVHGHRHLQARDDNVDVKLLSQGELAVEREAHLPDRAGRFVVLDAGLDHKLGRRRPPDGGPHLQEYVLDDVGLDLRDDDRLLADRQLVHGLAHGQRVPALHAPGGVGARRRHLPQLGARVAGAAVAALGGDAAHVRDERDRPLWRRRGEELGAAEAGEVVGVRVRALELTNARGAAALRQVRLQLEQAQIKECRRDHGGAGCRIPSARRRRGRGRRGRRRRRRQGRSQVARRLRVVEVVL
eukprot:7387105-Prymnesium_polylepis.1